MEATPRGQSETPGKADNAAKDGKADNSGVDGDAMDSEEESVRISPYGIITHILKMDEIAKNSQLSLTGCSEYFEQLAMLLIKCTDEQFTLFTTGFDALRSKWDKTEEDHVLKDTASADNKPAQSGSSQNEGVVPIEGPRFNYMVCKDCGGKIKLVGV